MSTMSERTDEDIETKPKKSRYDHVTKTILDQLEKGIKPWVQPWTEGKSQVQKPVKADGQPYNGINRLTLWAKQAEKNYGYHQWMTERQAQALGGHIIESEKKNKTWVVFLNSYTKTALDKETGDEIEREIRDYKSYPVYNVEQIKGLPHKFYDLIDIPALNDEERMAVADEYLSHINARVSHGFDHAAYRPETDTIELPDFNAFFDPVAYYGTRLHETIHWTGATERMKRDLSKGKYGDQKYAFEELVAELGNCYLSADLGLEPELREEHASDVSSWINLLKDHPKAIFKAAAYAQKAVNFLNGLQNKPQIDLGIDPSIEYDHDEDLAADVRAQVYTQKGPQP